jgi:hypothetical protein
MEPPLDAMPHVLGMVPYLCILVWYAIKCCVKLFMLILQVPMMVFHLSMPHAPFKQMWISSLDPFRTFLLGVFKLQLYSRIPFALKQKL